MAGTRLVKVCFLRHASIVHVQKQSTQLRLGKAGCSRWCLTSAPEETDLAHIEAGGGAKSKRAGRHWLSATPGFAQGCFRAPTCPGYMWQANLPFKKEILHISLNFKFPVELSPNFNNLS